MSPGFGLLGSLRDGTQAHCQGCAGLSPDTGVLGLPNKEKCKLTGWLIGHPLFTAQTGLASQASVYPLADKGLLFGKNS